MAPNHPGRLRWWALLAPFVIVPVIIFASQRWLNDPVDEWVSIGTSVSVLVYSLFLARWVTRRRDEVLIAGDHYATTNGFQFGTVAFFLVVMFTPLGDLLVELAYRLAGRDDPDRAIELGIWFGFMLTIVLQTLAMFAVGVWWYRRVVGAQD